MTTQVPQAGFQARALNQVFAFGVAHRTLGYLAAMKDHWRMRIMLPDGPAVLDQLELDRIDRATSAETLRRGLTEAMQAGQIEKLPLEALT